MAKESMGLSPVAGEEEDLSRGQTMEKIRLKCMECGDCLIWLGSQGRRGAPEVYHAGKRYQVREVVAHLTGHPKSGKKGVWATNCESPDCVAPEHVEHRSRGQNAKLKLESRPKAANQMRALNIARGKERKVPLEHIERIKRSKLSTKQLAEFYECDESLIRRYRARQHVSTPASPWSGLL